MTIAMQILNTAESSEVEIDHYVTSEILEGERNGVRNTLDDLKLLELLTGTVWSYENARKIQEFPLTYEYCHESGITATIQFDNFQNQLMPVMFTDGERKVMRRMKHLLCQKDMTDFADESEENKNLVVAVELAR